jgi:hypothetical protein
MDWRKLPTATYLVEVRKTATLEDPMPRTHATRAALADWRAAAADAVTARQTGADPAEAVAAAREARDRVHSSSVIGTAPAGSMAAGTGDVIRAEVRVTPSAYLPGHDVIDVPGLSYYGSRAEAAEAVRLLHLGQYPVVHGPVLRSGDLFTK